MSRPRAHERLNHQKMPFKGSPVKGVHESLSLALNEPLMVRTFLKVYMELGSYFLFLQEQIKDIIIGAEREQRGNSLGSSLPDCHVEVCGEWILKVVLIERRQVACRARTDYRFSSQ